MIYSLEGRQTIIQTHAHALKMYIVIYMVLFSMEKRTEKYEWKK